jgi:hypothetical protein
MFEAQPRESGLGAPEQEHSPQQQDPAEITSAEQTWYTILCILCGAGYLAKLPVAKAIS